MLKLSAFLATVLMTSACGIKSQGTQVKSDSTEAINQIFHERFYSNYQDRECGQNILGFVAALTKAGVDLSDYRIVKITNQGSGALGMVNAQSARSIRFNRPAAVELNWYHHVILMNQTTGVVYDFDYMTTPTPVSVGAYVESMFTNEPECAQPIRDLSTFCVGANQKLNSYLWEVSPVTPTEKPVARSMRDVVDQYVVSMGN